MFQIRSTFIKQYYLSDRALGWKLVNKSFTTPVLDDLSVQWNRQTHK